MNDFALRVKSLARLIPDRHDRLARRRARGVSMLPRSGFAKGALRSGLLVLALGLCFGPATSQTPVVGDPDVLAKKLAAEITTFVACENDVDSVVMIRAERTVLKADRAATLAALELIQHTDQVCEPLRHLAGELLVEARHEPLLFNQKLGLSIAQVQGAVAEAKAEVPSLRKAGLPPTSDRLKNSSDH